ncbi:hypothetical protein [Jatrophihabitans endophyticus]|uniref:hypothetical protein n=1 Tax=Jatrophihabitans endophyticus TaxID=1206085 RepID=UPI0009331A51|nr:hypothetical protein [Jatrophihabitans endophyticus]
MTVLGIFVGFLLAFAASLLVGSSPAYASGSGIGSGGSGSGGGSGPGGCAAFNTKWEFAHGSVPKTGSGCTNNTLTGSSCQTSAAEGSWIFYVTATSGGNEGKHISLPTSSGGFKFMRNKLTDLIQDDSNISAGFTRSAKASGYDNAPTRLAIKRWIESEISDGSFGAGSHAQWKELGGSNYRASNGKYLTYVCAWLSCGAHCNIPGVNPPVQYCSGYGVTSHTYVIRRGVNTATTEASSASDALAKCALHCPTSSSSDPNHVRAYIQHSGAAIRASYNTGAKMGAYCYYRTGTRNTETQTRLLTTSGKRTVSPEYIYGYNIDLLPDDEDFGQRTHPGPDKLVYQTTETVMPLGQFVNSYNYKNNTCPTVAQLNAAAAKNVGVSHGSVAVNAENKRGLAEGGILTVRENIERIQLLLTPTTKQPQVRTRVRTQVYSFTLYNTGAEYGVGDETGYYFSYTAWTAWKNSGSPVHSCGTGENTETGENGGLYQIFTNHCDASAAIQKGQSAGATVVDNGDSTKNFAGSVISRTDNLNEFEPQWGWGEGDRAGQWNKLCAYQGQKASTGSPASVTYFRDNTPHATSVDLYRPQSGGVVSYSGQDATATMVSLWNGSIQAPGVSDTGQFQMMANGQPLFGSDASPAPVLSQWGSVNAVQEKYFGLVPSQVTNLGMEADWPTDAGKPEVFTTKWIYTPQVSNTFPVVVGFDSHDQRTDTLGTVSTGIEGEVYSMQGTAAASPALTTLVKNSTGDIEHQGQPAITNTLDGRLAFGTRLDSTGAWIPEPVTYSPYYREVHFVRATTN